ncbi:hypothetical protein [Methylophilus sp. 5]|nr:hypothetical protein [Methylophilus sp. 5]
MGKKGFGSKADILPNPAPLVFVECRLRVLAANASCAEIVD